MPRDPAPGVRHTFKEHTTAVKDLPIALVLSIDGDVRPYVSREAVLAILAVPETPEALNPGS